MRPHQHRGEERAGGVEDPPESRAQEAEGAGVAGEGGGRLLARGKVRAEIVRVPVSIGGIGFGQSRGARGVVIPQYAL